MKYSLEYSPKKLRSLQLRGSSHGDTIYDKDDEVLRFEEWNKTEECIQNGLTIVVKGE